MKSPESFYSEDRYREYLIREFHKGRLLETTVDGTGKSEMIATVLAPRMKPGVYLEIGPASSPYCVDSVRTFNEVAHYIGIDGGKSDYSMSQLYGWAEFGSPRANDHIAIATIELAEQPHAYFVWGDAQALPLTDNDNAGAAPVRETFMRDVILQAGVQRSSMDRMFQEQARVLMEDGLLVIRETSFHGYANFFGGGISHSFMNLLASLDGAGFKKRVAIFDGEDAFYDLLKQFPGGEDAILGCDGYYLLCQKGEDNIVAPDSWRQKIRHYLGKLLR